MQTKPKWSSISWALRVFLVLTIIIYIIRHLDKANYITITPDFLFMTRILLTIVLTLFITSVIARMTVNRVFLFMRRFAKTEESIFVSKMYAVFIYVLGILYISYTAGLTLDNIALFLGLITTGLAFALREVILSYFVWAIILNKTPFQIDDYIKIGEEVGKVTRIGTFFVTLLDKDDHILKVPNKTFLDKTATNYGKDTMIETIRLPVSCLPANSKERITKLEEKLGKLTITEQSVTFHADTVTLICYITYAVSPTIKKQMRTEVLQLAEKAISDIQKKS